ncbi:MAG: hypothetical protein LBQ47_00520 [Endomicrobium sp.]|jgi:pyruvate,water dikinase|nr:hypothetical protein [Endomicrobium sp.]
MKIKSSLKKITVFVTALSVLFSPFLSFAPYAFADVYGVSPESVFSIPASLGTVTALKNFGGRNFVINIQDLHCDGGAQRNIAAILKYLEENYGIKKVYLEGACADVDVAPLSGLLNTSLGRQTLEFMTDSGYVNGVEYYAALNSKKGFARGIEDFELYEKNINLLAQIMSSESEIEAVCSSLEAEIAPVKRKYSNARIKALDRLVRSFERGKTSRDKFYLKLMSYGVSGNYDSIKAYIEMSAAAASFNGGKTSKEFPLFINSLKSFLPYKEFSRLSAASSGFSCAENISKELLELSEKYSLFSGDKFESVKKYLSYLQYLKSINPVDLALEEKELISAAYGRLSSDAYEREVSFLDGFIPEIKGYFTAEITSYELESFAENFKRFRRIWCSYFAQNTVKKLDKYADLLASYHENNLKRDAVFAKSAGLDFSADDARENIKVIVTGGFHSGGLEKILNEKSTSYAVITPKISDKISQARATYESIIKSYAGARVSAIAVEPYLNRPIENALAQLTAGCVAALDKSKYSLKEKEEALYSFIKDFLEKRKASGYSADASLKIDSYGKKEVLFSVSSGADEKNPRFYRASSKGVLSQYSLGEDKKSFEKPKISSLLKEILLAFRHSLSFAKPKKISSLLKVDSLYKTLNVYAMAVVEEFFFRTVPFTGTYKALSSFLIPTAILLIVSYVATIAIGVFLFAKLHNVIDKYDFKKGKIKKEQIRTLKSMVRPLSVLTASYLAVVISGLSFGFGFDRSILFAWFFSSVFHIAHNIRAYNKIKQAKQDNTNAKFRLLSLFSSAFRDKNEAEKEIVDLQDLRQTVKNLEELRSGASFSADINDKVLVDEYESALKELAAAADLNGSARYNAACAAALKLYDFALKVKHEVKSEIFSALLPIAAYINDNSSQTLLNKIFNYMFFNISDFIFQKEFLINLSARQYLTDKEAAIKMLKSLTREQTGRSYSFTPVIFPSSITNIEEGRTYLPYEWKNLISDEELEEFYDKFGVVFAVKGYRSKISYSVSVTDEFFRLLQKLPRKQKSKKLLSALGREYENPAQIKVFHAENAAAKSSEIASKFDALNRILDDNSAAVAAIMNITPSSFESVFSLLSAMIADLKIINRYSAASLAKSLENIKSSLLQNPSDENIALQKQLLPWSSYSLSKISELHTLLNAIHQTSLNKIMFAHNPKEDTEFAAQDGAKRIVLNPVEVLAQIYDFSQNKSLSRAGADFLSGLNNIKYRLRLLLKDDKFIWSKSPRSHSVDILIDLNDAEAGLRFGYIDKSYPEKNALIKTRAEKFKEQLSAIGMKVTIDKVGSFWRISAYAGASSKFHASKEYAQKFIRLIEIIQQNAPVYEGEEKLYFNEEDQKPDMSGVYSYLGVENEPFPEGAALRKFADGKIIINDKGILVLDNSYNPAAQILKEAPKKAQDMILQAKTLESLERSLFDFGSQGYAGKALIEVGALKLKEGYLSVKSARSADVSAALCEFVSLSGARKVLDDEQLREILAAEGYELCVKETPYEPAAGYFMSALNAPQRQINAKEITGIGVANGNYGFIFAKVSYNAQTAGKGDIFITGNLSRSDRAKWENVEGIVMTSGGITSHVALIANEKKKPLIALMGASYNSKIPYINEGDVIALDAVNGRIFVFDKISNNLMRLLQEALKENSVSKIKYLIKSASPEIAAQAIQYVFYYCFGKAEYASTLEMLDGIDSGEIIKNLRLGYESALEIEESINNAKNLFESSADNAYMAYSLLMNAAVRLESANGLSADILKELADKINDLREIIENSVYKKISSDVNVMRLYRAQLDKAARYPSNLEALIAVAGYYNNFYAIKDAAAEIEKSEEAIDDYNRSQKKEVLDLKELGYLNLEKLFGSKAVKLSYANSLLASANFPADAGIAEGFAVSKTAFERFLDDNAVLDDFKKAVENFDEQTALDLAGKISAKIDAFDESQINALIGGHLSGDALYAVRSSGINEDGAKHSFAGMASTVLNASKENAAKSLKRVWKSFYEPQIVKYMAENGQTAQPAVFIQEMVGEQIIAGQIITRNRQGDSVIEAVRGLGEASVSATVTPDIAVIKNADGYVSYKKASDRKIKAVKSENGFKYEALSSEEKANRVLDMNLIERLRLISSGLESVFKYPLDIEFAVDAKGKIYILQVRPVTSFVAQDAFSSERFARKNYQTAVVFKDDENGKIQKKELFFITDPKTGDDPVKVYFDGYDNNNKTLIFSLSSKYSSYDKNEILAAITEKLGDKNIISKLNKKMPIAAKMRPVSFFTPDPFYENPQIDDLFKRPTPAQAANKLLCAA